MCDVFSLFGPDDLDLMTRLFQGQLVLRTRCLECESFTERREDFQDISVPVLDDTPSSPDALSEGESPTESQSSSAPPAEQEQHVHARTHTPTHVHQHGLIFQ